MKKKDKSVKVPSIVKQSLLEYVSEAYRVYGSTIVQNRALPDYRDGLKPVHRRILWSMHKLAVNSKGNFKKSARIVGECMGKYHPHGDSPIYQAMVNMVNAPTQLIDGQGNWGSALGDPAAASRYTECRLSKYSDSFMLPNEYLNVIPYHPNYDSSEEEPLYLPSLLPNLLFNGTYGIAVGVTSGIPSFRPLGVLNLLIDALSGAEISHKLCLKHLSAYYQYGNDTITEKDSLVELYKTGRGSLAYDVDYDIDKPNKRMLITGITPSFDIANLIKKTDKLAEVSGVADLTNSGKINVAVNFKDTVSGNEIERLVEKVAGLLTARVSYKVNITIRMDEDNAKFLETTVVNLLRDWLEYRIQLEKDCQKYRISVFDEDIGRQNLLILAAQNAEFITKTVRSKDVNPKATISKKLKITEEETAYILTFTFNQISRLNEEKIREKLAALEAGKKKAVFWYKNPDKKTLADIKLIVDKKMM